MRVGPYLERIRYDGARHPTAETLQRVHLAHMLAVPFENLDIRLGTPIVLSLPDLYRKIVARRRGGFCYELNGLFGWLLAELGFRVALLSARVFGQEQLSPEFDHLLLLVECGGLDGRWIADVGFGDSFLQPLRLDSNLETEQQGWWYAIVEEGSDWTLRRRREGGIWEPQYQFSLTPRRLDEFAPRCVYHQTSADSHFTRKTICSLVTEMGRITLSNGRFLHTTGEQREERVVLGAEEVRAILATDFGVELEPSATEQLVLRNSTV